MKNRQLGNNGPIVAEIGLGCMGMTPIYATPDPQEAKATIHAAIDAGVTLLDTSDAYAGGKNEALVGEAIAGKRDRVVLATKFGNIRLPDGTRSVNGHPDYVAEACDASLQRLGVDHIDLYYQHRVDPDVPIEETVGAMSRLIEQGKVGALGLSEAGAQTIRRAHATHPIACLQTEYSLASRDCEADVLPTCRELGIGYVAYAPLSRGLLTGEISSLNELGENDRRRAMPRFQDENIETNLSMVEQLAEIAKSRGISTAAVAIGWVLAKGNDIVPIPGCSRRTTLVDSISAARAQLAPDDVDRIEQALRADAIAGTRYPPGGLKRLGL